MPSDRNTAEEPQDSEESTVGEQHDAVLVYYDTRQGEMVSWGWSDGRMTVSPDEHDAVKKWTAEAENRLDYSQLESGDVVAKVWMNDDETVREVEWCDQ